MWPTRSWMKKKTRSGLCRPAAKRRCRWFAFPQWTTRHFANASARFYSVGVSVMRSPPAQYVYYGENYAAKRKNNGTRRQQDRISLRCGGATQAAPAVNGHHPDSGKPEPG